MAVFWRRRVAFTTIAMAVLLPVSRTNRKRQKYYNETKSQRIDFSCPATREEMAASA
jgi:hypothetical protein